MNFMAAQNEELLPYRQENCFRDTKFAFADNIPRMATDFQMRLRTRMAELGLSARRASAQAGLSPDAVGKMLKDGAGLPRGGNLTGLAQALGTTEQWLLTGNQAHASPVTPEEASVQQAAGEVEIKAVAAGSEEGAFQLFDNAIGWTPLPRGLARHHDVYAIIVINDSMYPEHKPGQIRYVTPSIPPRLGDSVIIEFTRDPDLGPEAMIGHLEQRGEIVKIGKLHPERRTVEVHRAIVSRLHRIATEHETR